MKNSIKVRFQHLALILVLLVISLLVAFASMPIAPDGEYFIWLTLGAIAVTHLFAAGVSLCLSKITWTSVGCISAICFLPSGILAGHAIWDRAHLRYFAVSERLRDHLSNPIPKSVKNLQFIPLEDNISADLVFQFDIDPRDLRSIIRSKGLKVVQPDQLMCPKDYFQYPYYLPVKGSFVLYQAMVGEDDILTLKVNEAHNHAVFRLESRAYYDGHCRQPNPVIVKMDEEALGKLKAKWEAENGPEKPIPPTNK